MDYNLQHSALLSVRLKSRPSLSLIREMASNPPTAPLGSESQSHDQNRFMREALAMGQAALTNGEIPVGCVIVQSRGDEYCIIASGSNQTNASRNGTRHAEIVAVESLYSAESSFTPDDTSRVLSSCDLYVTCEPCIMCAAALSKLGVRKVFFGCHNDRFGGNGSILSVHTDAYSSSAPIGGGEGSVAEQTADSLADTADSTSSSSSSSSSSGNSSGGTSSSSDMVCESPAPAAGSSYHRYEVQAGLLKEEAIELFQHFYTTENRRAPEAKRKRKIDKTFNSGAISALSKEQ